jgi:hypothetical protein
VPRPKSQVSQPSTDVTETNPLAKTDPAVGLSEDAIRIRAYQIYEFRNRTNDQAADDWFQAQRELTELLCGI